MKNRLPELRKKRKLSQEELAREVGVTRQTITSIETGKYIASLPLAFKIARFFNLSIEDIFQMDEEEE
ncbi:MAG: helix-turn-helix transcriptional regulator [Eubacteriales bacterium]|nr:helix-turn-helix transcriptional regulator [Eubacteriales bacterium]